MNNAKKAIIVVGALGIGGALAFTATQSYAQSEFQNRFVAPAQEMGFVVEHSQLGFGKGSDDAGMLSLGTEYVVLKKDGAILSLEGIDFGAHQMSFNSAALTSVEGEPLLYSGEGHLTFDKGHELALKLDDIKAGGQMSQLSGTAGVEAFDFAMSHVQVGENLQSDMTVDVDGVAKVTVSSTMEVNPWSSTSVPELEATLAQAGLSSGVVAIENKGGFNQVVQTMAMTQGVPPQRAMELLQNGIAQSQIPEQYKTPLVKFAQSPDVIRFMVSPKAPNGEAVKVVELSKMVQMMPHNAVYRDQFIDLVNLSIEVGG